MSAEAARGGSSDRGFFGHPRGLGVLFFTEVREITITPGCRRESEVTLEHIARHLPHSSEWRCLAGL